MLVNDTEPIFFYCGAPGSCKEYSMVGVVNPTKDKTLAIQKEYAANSTIQLLPGDPWPSETASQPSDPKSAVPGAGTDTSPTSSPSSSSSSSSSLGAGAIAGIAIGAAAVVLLGAALIYLCGRRGGFERAYRKTHSAPGIIPGGMIENKYNDPKSPGATTMASSYDPYRSSTQPSQHLGYGGTPGAPHSPGMAGYAGAPPPHSPGMPGYAAHPSAPSTHGYYPPPMSETGTYNPHQAPYQ